MTPFISTNLVRLLIVGVLAVSPSAPARDQGSTLSVSTPADQLVETVVANELKDRLQQRSWMYRLEKRVGAQTLTEEQVETVQGPLYRLLAIDGVPLTPAQRQQDDNRIRGFLRDTSQQMKLKQQHEDDEAKLESIMKVMPQAFLYEYDGVQGTLMRLKFRPDPSYQAPNYETRVVHNLSGIILIDPQQKRLAKFSGELLDSLQFGFGILGRIDKGGTMEIGRVQVGPTQWKTALINVRLSGRLVFFKSAGKQQYETRSKFRAVSADLTLLQGNELLVR